MVLLSYLTMRPPAGAEVIGYLADVITALGKVVGRTTGTPKGAPRSEPRSLAPLGALLSRVPLKARGITVLPAPMFHTLGFAHALLAVGVGDAS